MFDIEKELGVTEKKFKERHPEKGIPKHKIQLRYDTWVYLTDKELINSDWKDNPAVIKYLNKGEK